MKKLIALTSFIALISVALLVFNLASRQLMSLSNDNFTVNYAEGSPLNGEAFIAIETQWQPLWFDVEWHWCPRLNPLSWCLTIQGDTVSGQALLSTSLSTISVHDALLSADSINLVLAGFIPAEATIDTRIKQLTLTQSHQLDAIKSIDADVLLSNINVLGFAFSSHKLIISRPANEDFSVLISGEEANGTASAKVNGEYQADLTIKPEPAIANMLKQQLEQAPDGRFIYRVNGTLPVVM